MGNVLSLFTSVQPEWGVREAAGALDVPRSNAHEILSSMASVGLLQRTEKGRYRLGWRLLTISRSLIYGAGFHGESMAVMREVVSHVGETASIGVWDGRTAVCLASIQGARPERVQAKGMGARLPGHASALGKTLLAHRDTSEVSDLIEVHGLPKLTIQTSTNRAGFLSELDEIRARGLAQSYEESTVGVSCLAAAVRDASSAVVGALSISVRADRMAANRDHYSKVIREAATRLSARLAQTRSVVNAAATVPAGAGALAGTVSIAVR